MRGHVIFRAAVRTMIRHLAQRVFRPIADKLHIVHCPAIGIWTLHFAGHLNTSPISLDRSTSLARNLDQGADVAQDLIALELLEAIDRGFKVGVPFVGIRVDETNRGVQI